MRVLLVSANTEQINILPLPLGLNCVAVAARNAGHEIKWMDLMTGADHRISLSKEIRNYGPEVIGISVRNIDDQHMDDPKFLLTPLKEVVRDCRDASNAPLVLGGAGYSIFPESALDYLEADMGIQGEGERAFPLLLDRIQKGLPLSGVPGLFLRGKGLQGPREFVRDLDTLPLPDAGISAAIACDRQEMWMPFQTRRGCPLNCSYCSTFMIEGCTLRKRSPGSVIEAIARHVDVGFERFYFVDNIFNIPPSYAERICQDIIERGLKISWRCIYYPGKTDERLIGLMSKSGCTEVSLGFESGSENILHRMNKKFGPAQVRRASESLGKNGIRRGGFLMLGGPGETKETVRESLDFADSLHLDSLKITIGIRIYPNTALAKCATDEGLISPGDNLLFPKFYVVKDLNEWLHETVQSWRTERPYVMN